MKAHKIMAVCLVLLVGVIAILLESNGKEPLIQGKISLHDQWANSPHAGSLDTPEEKVSMNKPGCAKCHTAAGYQEVILAGKDSTAPYENVTGITCAACHDMEKISKDDPAIRADSVAKSCVGCHNILFHSVKKSFTASLQGSMVKGKDGSEFDGEKYKSSAHSMIPKNCVGCHMAESPEGDRALYLGGHTFLAAAEFDGKRVLNSNACVGCHKGITMDDVVKSQSEFKELLTELENLLPKQEGDSPGSDVLAPKFPKDSSLSPVESKASFNYYFVLKDGTLGLHNPTYCKKLLEDSIAALKK